MTDRETLARILCKMRGYDPDRLEPGNTPYSSDEEVVDGQLQGGPAFFMWRQYEEDAAEILALLPSLCYVRGDEVVEVDMDCLYRSGLCGKAKITVSSLIAAARAGKVRVEGE